MLRARLIAVFPGRLAVNPHHIPGGLDVRLEVDVWVVAFRTPDQRLRAAGAGDPDGRMRLLEWRLKGVHHPELVVLPLPAKRPRRCPRLDDQLVGFLETLAVIYGVAVGRPGLNA